VSTAAAVCSEETEEIVADTTTGGASRLSARTALRLEVEGFLIEEAALLDAWDLDAWLELFTDDGKYVVPATDLADGDPARDLTLIDVSRAVMPTGSSRGPGRAGL
jgi:hypothetical protein